jgi:hypothetical protein
MHHHTQLLVEIGASLTFGLGWPQMESLPISASWIGGTFDLDHAWPKFLLTLTLNTVVLKAKNPLKGIRKGETLVTWRWLGEERPAKPGRKGQGRCRQERRTFSLDEGTRKSKGAKAEQNQRKNCCGWKTDFCIREALGHKFRMVGWGQVTENTKRG